MEKEAEAAADKAEAWRRAAAASVEVAEAQEKAQREAARGSMLASELQLKVKDTEEALRQHQLHRLKILVRDSLHWKTLRRTQHISVELRVGTRGV